MQIKTNIDKELWFLLPCIGVINLSKYFGYPSFEVCFGWFVWQISFVFQGGPKRRADNG